MLTVADLMVRGMALPPLDSAKYEPVACPPGTHCAITGQAISHGYPAQRIVSSVTGEFLDLLHGDVTGYMSEAAARAFKGSQNMGSRMLFEDGTHYHPLISSQSAGKSDRTYWSALVRDVWPGYAGMRYVAIVATDFKKKIWPAARVGVLGHASPVLVFDNSRDVLANVVVDWPHLIQVLELVEEVYTAGFSKSSIERNLLADAKMVGDVGFSQAHDWETRLARLRHEPEFKFASIIAQKGA